MDDEIQHALSQLAETYLDAHGPDTPLGVGWTRAFLGRYEAMFDLIRWDRGRDADAPVVLADLGCGAGHFYEFVQQRADWEFDYTGIDISTAFLDASRARFPEAQFVELDILKHQGPLPEFDYVIANGLLNSKGELSWDAMWDYSKRLIRAAYSMTRRGLAFNVMTTHLDWERPDLFHVAFDDMATFVRAELSHHFVFRQDYGAFEYTIYVYRGPSTSPD
ncbi:MAG: class I SAM-dependent methyltransferase [Actinomycetota bacterium]